MKKIVVLITILILLVPTYLKAFEVGSECVILMDQNNERILYGKNIHKVKSIASISKIMTAIIALESNKVNEIVKIDEDVLKAYGSAIYIKVGEEMKLLDLIYGLMLRSGNDAALAIAKYIGGSVDNFVVMMNEKAQELGMKNTVFNNPSGLDNEKGNYSSVYDMAILTSYAMKNDLYRQITSTKSYKVKTNLNYYDWTNKNKLLNSYKYATGGKTGFTEIAKRTLVTTASKDGLDLVVVTLNDGNDFSNHKELYEEAFDSYKNIQILKQGEINIYGENYYKNKIFYLKNNFSYPLNDLETGSIYLHIEILKKRSYKQNDKVGTIKVILGDTSIKEVDIFIRNKEEKKSNIWEWIKNLW